MTTTEDLYAPFEMQPGLGNEDAQTEIPKEQFDDEPKHPFFGEPKSSTFLTFFKVFDKWCDSEVANGHPTQKEFADRKKEKKEKEEKEEKTKTPTILVYWH